jgi:hypothetical protein
MCLRLAFPLLTVLLAASPLLARAESTVLPPAMLSACKHQGVGAPCRFPMGGKDIHGSCQSLPNQELACRPGGGAKPAPEKPKK